jgi:hypothetical protein
MLRFGCLAVPQDGVSFTVRDKRLKSLIKQFPRIMNTEMNRAFKLLGSQFARYFAKTRLIAGVYRVRRKSAVKGKRSGGGAINMGKKARLAGFGAKLMHPKSLTQKVMRLNSRNPALTIKEKGGIIRPKKGEYLYIRGEFKGRGAKSRRSQFAQGQHFKKQRGGRKHDKPIVALVRSVKVKATLGFSRAWKRWSAKRRDILHKRLVEATRRAALLTSRSTGRRAA